MKTTRLLGSVAALLVGGGIGGSAQALTINPVFDSSITSLPNAFQVQTEFRAIANLYGLLFADPVTVNIAVSWGSVGGLTLPSNAVGSSLDSLYGYFSYANMRSLVQNNQTTGNDIAAFKSLPATAPSGPTSYVLTSAQAKALGVLPGNNAATDGSIGFAGSSTTSFFYGGVPVAGAYDFRAVAAHEIEEVLGLISGIGSSNPQYRSMLDLFRYSSPGVLDYSTTGAAYFSIDGGVSNLGNYNNAATGDHADWLTVSTSNDIQDAFISTGQTLNLTAVDLTELDVIGWDWGNFPSSGFNVGTAQAQFPIVTLVEAVPEPSTLAIFGIGLLGIGTVARRRR